MKLFASVVQPTLLYGCASWTMTRKRQATIRSLQRKMLRAVVGVRRQRLKQDGETVLEDWVPWIQRAAGEAEKQRCQHHIPSWVEEISRRKFRWAGHVARRHDGRWTKVMLEWSLAGWRQRGRPVSRWFDSINKYFGSLAGTSVGSSTWISVARNRENWKQIEDHYIPFCR